MEKLKERWEFIIGYVALIVSLSAFKDELAKIGLNIGFSSFNAAQFLFILILGFFITLHLYLIPFLFSSTKYADKRIFSLLESLSYFIFVLLCVSPFFILLAVGTNAIINYFRSVPPETKTLINAAVSLIISILSGIISKVIANKYRKQKYSTEKQELEYLEIKEFENAQKLFADGYYSQSILEAFKSLELHLRRLIFQKGINLRSNKFQDVVDLAKKHGILFEKDMKIITLIRQMRNSAAHLDVDFTKSQATEAISFIKELIRRTAQANSNAT
jgi:uncharacterized membrane protein